MKKYYKDWKTITYILAAIVMYFFVPKSFFRSFSDIFFVLLLGIFAFSLFKKIVYLLGKANYILVPTGNDLFSRIRDLIIGPALAVGILLIIGRSHLDKSAIVMISVGVVMFLNGVLGLPLGFLQIRKGYFTLHGINKRIDVQTIETIVISNDKLEIHTATNEKYFARNFIIDRAFSEVIEMYLLSKKTDEMNFNIINEAV
jgi:hypothetical protein